MAQSKKTNGSITVKGADGKIVDNIPADSLTPATPTAAVAPPTGSDPLLARVQAKFDAMGFGDVIQIKDLTGLTTWNLEITSEMEHSRGVAWTGVLRHTSGHIVHVENLGDGGGNNYTGSREARQLFTGHAEAAFPGEFDSEDSLVMAIDIVG